MGKKFDELRKRLKRLEKQVAAFLSPKPAKSTKGKPKAKAGLPSLNRMGVRRTSPR